MTFVAISKSDLLRKLVTLVEWRKLSPDMQGFVLYMQSSHEGSELARQHNPYPRGSEKDLAFREGERRAVLVAQDSEE